MPSATRTVTQIRNTAANALLLTAFLLSGTITSMDRVPMDIGEWISEDAKKGALEAGAWMAEHPEALFEMTERDRKCRTAYIRELKTGRPPKEPPEGYAKFVTYVGPSIAADFAAGKVAKLDRRERRWETVHRAASVAAIVAAIAGIAAFALNLWLVLR